MIKEYLLKNYGYNEPIFLNELKIEELSENAVRQSIKRLKANGFLERYDNGIYYIPKKGVILEKSYLDPQLVIKRKYIQSKSETYGYITGISFANQLGVTTQMPAVIEIVTNRESSNGRFVKIGNQKLRVKRTSINISKSNVEILQLIDSIGWIEQYSELPTQETINKIIEYIRSKKFTKNQLLEVSSYLTGATAKRLIEWGIIYEFA